jgi:hypothetical protein
LLQKEFNYEIFMEGREMKVKKINILNYAVAYMSNVWGFGISKSRKKKVPNNYYSKDILPQQQGSNYIKKLLDSNEPFVVARFGSTELACFHDYLKIKLGLKKSFRSIVIFGIKNYSGFFPARHNELMQFGDLLSTSYLEIDVLAVFNMHMEDYVTECFCHKAKLTVLRTVDPILSSWTTCLAGKKVLVIHPFAELILSQYQKREHLFEDKDKLPIFDIKVYKAIQTIAGASDDRFNSWFEALDYMISEISKIDFDVALIGAGAYGLPLAVKIKTKLNKQAIHIGGATQLLFGIKGKRWDVKKDFVKYYNDYWVRPDERLIPKDANNVEGGCYW